MEEGSDREDVTPGARVKDIVFVVRCTCLVFFFSFMNIFTPEDMRIIRMSHFQSFIGPQLWFKQ